MEIYFFTKVSKLSEIKYILVISFILLTNLSTCKPLIVVDSLIGYDTWDISPFGDLRYWSVETGVLGKNLKQNYLFQVPKTADNEWNAGIYWKEERDISQVSITYDSNISETFLKETKIQYWFNTWPIKVPKIQQEGEFVKSMVEYDHVDDPWQGMWLTAETNFQKDGKKVVYTFKPITKYENRQADNLPEPVTYRRTLKIRILYNNNPPLVKTLNVFSPTISKKISVRIEFGCDKPIKKAIEGNLSIFNGKIENISGWKWDTNDKLNTNYAWKFLLNNRSKGLLIDLIAAKPTLLGSNDLTIVTVHFFEGTFSFLVDDLDNGPIYIPVFSVYITNASDNSKFEKSDAVEGLKIREKLITEPEQTYSRARREIPDLEVMFRRGGGKLYLPLAVDASWQKFAVEWGGGFFMNKDLTKAKGNERERCLWRNNELHWFIGTGEVPVYERDDKNSHMSVLDGYLPIPEINWHHEGLIYQEEALATLLEGPLSPYDVRRDEQTPAILMVKLDVTNPTNKLKKTHIWLKADSLSKPTLQDLFIMDQINGERFVRAKITLSEGISTSDIKMIKNAVNIPITIPANQKVTIYFSVPFVGDLTEVFKGKISSLDYSAEHLNISSYWRDIVNEYVGYNVPEEKFNDLARSVLPHIRMSTTKDPKSGLFMVPAGSFKYQVYANEAAFQTILLDKIGDHKTAASYLETFLKLQGSVPMFGSFTGNQDAVFHGTKVNNEYDYTASKYNLDHGTVLWALGQHYLLSRDPTWIQHASPSMLKAVEWIIEQRNQTKMVDKNGNNVLHYGLLPAGNLEDNNDWGFWFAVNAYAYLGMRSTADAFKKAGLTEYSWLEKETQNYLEDIKSSVKRASELAPVVRLRNNTYVPYIPTRAYQRFRYFGPMKEGYYSRYGKTVPGISYKYTACREALYGPMILITTGILDPQELLSESILDDWEDNITLSSSLGLNVHGLVDDEYWFSRGGMVFQPNLQNPIKAYLLRNEIPAAIRSIYNSMVSCLYSDVNAFTEEYHRWGIGSGPMYKIPDEARFVNRVIDLLILEAGNELWLASGTPRYWLEPGKRIKLFNTATVFGNISYELWNGDKPNTIEASIKLSAKMPDGKIKLFVRAPFDKPIKSVTVNGKEWGNWDQVSESIVLPTESERTEVVIIY